MKCTQPHEVSFFTCLLILGAFLVGCPAPDIDNWNPTEPSTLWTPHTSTPIPLPPALSDVSGLDDIGGWGQEGLILGRAEAGSFGVGNGRVFGLIGMDDPVNTITGAIGPGYQRPNEGFFGDHAVRLTRAGVPLGIEDEVLQRPRRSAVVRTMASSGSLSLTTDDVADPTNDHIIRHITVWNDGPQEAELSLLLTLARAPAEVDPADARGLLQSRGQKELLISCADAATTIGRETMEIAIPTLEPGTSWSTTCSLDFSLVGGQHDLVPADPQSIFNDSIALTSIFLDEALRLQTPDPMVDDLLEGLLITIFTQTTDTGLVSPMNRYTKGWLRDIEGPLLLLLATGHHERARTLLDATYQSLAVLGQISNSFELEVDLDLFSEPANPTSFWDSVPFMNGRGKAEAPSYPVLLHRDYVQRTGDDTILNAGRLAFLEACMLRQEISGDGLLPFSEDETYRYPMSFVIGGLPETIGWSAHSSFVFAPAAEFLVEYRGDDQLGGLAQQVREAAVQHYWLEDRGVWASVAAFDSLAPVAAPYEDVSMMPLWVGYHTGDDPTVQDHLDAVQEVLLREDGTALSEAAVAGYTGMMPGYLLANAARAHHTMEDTAFNGIYTVATPSGHFEETHARSNEALDLTHVPDGTGSDVTARYRPWEGGDVGTGLLRYLVGDQPLPAEQRLVLAPHIPNDWSGFAVDHLPFGEERYQMEVRNYQEGQVIELTRTGSGSQDWTVDVVLHGMEPFSSLWVNGKKIRNQHELVERASDIVFPPETSLQIIAKYSL